MIILRRNSHFHHFVVILITLTGSQFSLTGQDKLSKKTSAPTPAQSIIVVQGAGGSSEYRKIFSDACEKIREAASKSRSEFHWIGNPNSKDDQSGENSDKSKLKKLLTDQLNGSSQLWVILIGHGTYDRRLAKFNLRGPDVSAKELNEWLGEGKRPIAIINCASASSPFINRLAGNGRVIVTATKSGFELNYARFGVHFANALTDLSADIDKDEQVSLLESFLFASRKVEEFFKSESRLATEHALLDDNGDGKGTPLDFFRGIRVVKKGENDEIPDGPVANQIHLIKSEFEKLLTIENRRQRSELETQLEKLRLRKSELDEDEYFRQLEDIAIQISRLYEQIETKSKKQDTPNPKDSAISKPESNKKKPDTPDKTKK